MPKSTQPPKSFTFRGVKFTLDISGNCYRHRKLRGMRAEVYRAFDGGWAAAVNALIDTNSMVFGYADHKRPEKALAMASKNLEREAWKKLREMATSMAPSLKVAKAKVWR